MGEFDVKPTGLVVPMPRGDEFRLPLVPTIPMPLPLPIPMPVPIDRETINKALHKGHEILKGLFDTVTKPPQRYLAEGAAIVGAHALGGPSPGLAVAGSVIVLEGAQLAKAIYYMAKFND